MDHWTNEWTSEWTIGSKCTSSGCPLRAVEDLHEGRDASRAFYGDGGGGGADVAPEERDAAGWNKHAGRWEDRARWGVGASQTRSRPTRFTGFWFEQRRLVSKRGGKIE